MRANGPAYRLDAPEVDRAIGHCIPSQNHRELLATVQRLAGWEQAKVATVRDEGMRRVARKVVTPEGVVVASDHQVWLRDQLAAHGGDAPGTRHDLAQYAYRLTACELKAVYLVSDRGGARADDFVQMIVWEENEFLDLELFATPAYGGPPRDLQDRLHELGPPLEARTRFRPPSYVADTAIDVARFVDELDLVDRQRRASQAKRMVRLTDTATGQSRVLALGELHPDVTRDASSARRLFDDWAYSSAGRSGARFSDHWVLVRSYEHTAPGGERYLGLTPGWTYPGKLAEVKFKRGGVNDYELAGKLQNLDERVKVPFGWFFFMLHGNRVKDWAGRQMLKAAESGRIVLAEHDYRILRNWAASPYGF